MSENVNETKPKVVSKVIEKSPISGRLGGGINLIPDLTEKQKKR